MKKLPSEVRTMTLPQVYDLFDYWKGNPPEHEIIAMLASVYTTWRPDRVVTEDDHKRSLEQRWASGALSPKDMLRGMPMLSPLLPGEKPPGIGDFPGRSAMH